MAHLTLHSLQRLLQEALSELVEPQHQAKSMAVLGSAWGFALIFGPAVGGWLSQP